MGFFLSHRTFLSIMKRSARYWITSYMGNIIWGPPGYRRNSRRYHRAAPVVLPQKPIFTPEPPCSSPNELTSYDKDRMRHSKALDEAEGRIRAKATRRGVSLYDAPPPAVTRAGGLRGGAANKWRKYRSINK